MLERFKKSDSYGVWLNLLISCLYCWYLFRTVLLSPGHTFFSTGGDGAKNYYTYLYHVLFGKGFHFEGMNYPWGEHVSFTDNQPLLALPLSSISSGLHLSVNHLLALMNLLIIFSFVLSAHLLFRFFSRQGVHPLHAALFALLSTFLWPGFARVFGHFGLCYTFHLILTLYWLFQYRSTRKKIYLAALFVLCFAIAFVHMYNLLLCMLIIFFFAIGILFFEQESLRQKLKQAGSLMAVVILSFVAVKLVFLLTDPIKDRPVNPWGILHYVSTLKQLFTSDFSYLGKTFSLLFDGFVTTELDEGYAYAGIISLAYLLYVLINFIFYCFGKSRLALYTPLSTSEKYLLFIGACSWLLCIGFPFTFGFEKLLDFLPAIKQFRSLGRISVITYFCLALSAVLCVSRLIKHYTANQQFRSVFYVSLVIISLWSIEIFSYSKYMQRRADDADDNYRNFFMLKDQHDDVVVKKDTQYQCIIGLPFFCIGSEKLGKDVDSEFSGDLFRLSLQTGIPLVNTLMSRSSWRQSFQLMRLAGGPFTDKTFFTASIDQRPFLLVRLKDAVLTEDERSLMMYCDSLSEQGRTVLYRMNWQQLMQAQRQMIDSLNSLPLHQEDQNGSLVFYNHFDEGNGKEIFFGKGSLNVSQTDTVVLLQQDISPDTTIRFEFSVWAKAVSQDYRMPHCIILQYDSTGNEIGNLMVHAQHSVDNRGFWFRIATEIDLDKRVKNITILYRNNADHAATSIDEFLFKPLHQFVVQEDTHAALRLYNNHLISLKPTQQHGP